METDDMTSSDALSALMLPRCLRPETLSKFGVRADERAQAWTYPATGGMRYKAFDPEARGMKYWHTTGTPAQFYGLDLVAPGTREVWLVNGEPSVWACAQAGVAAVCTFGEGRLPAEPIEPLFSRGIRHVRVAFDLDDAGWKAAADVYRTLREPLLVTVHRLPQALGARGDVGDLYSSTGGDDALFRSLLEQLPAVALDDLAALAGIDAHTVHARTSPKRRARPRRRPAAFSLPRWWVDGQVLVDVVSSKIEVRRQGAGWVARCPFHEDRTPSLHLYADGGWTCFGCRQHGTAVDFIAKVEHIAWKDALARVRALVGGPPLSRGNGKQGQLAPTSSEASRP